MFPRPVSAHPFLTLTAQRSSVKELNIMAASHLLPHPYPAVGVLDVLMTRSFALKLLAIPAPEKLTGVTQAPEEIGRAHV